MLFTSIEFQDTCQICVVHLTLEAPGHQGMNGQVEVKQRTLCKISHSLMVHARVLEYYINFALMNRTYQIFWYYQSNT